MFPSSNLCGKTESMTEVDDFTWVREAQAGDRQAFARLVQRHYRLMYKLAWQFCGVKDQAEDIAQEASIKLAQSLGAFRFESSFTTWLYRLVINTAKDNARGRNRRSENELPLFEDAVFVSPEASPEQKLQDKDVLKMVARLPVDLKETVILCYWQGLSHKEASMVLECSEGTVSWRLHEARKKMGSELGIKGEGRNHG
ncbi:MAG: polymerase subunit sigma-24 [Alphaproteobacteria bacterium]|nr:polymerase subunit sigma-24 [Alphaproteobacteria bacterium]